MNRNPYALGEIDTLKPSEYGFDLKITDSEGNETKWIKIGEERLKLIRETFEAGDIDPDDLPL